MSEHEQGSPLFKNGDGLFNTHVHLEDVQQVIGEQMNTRARLGENTKYTLKDSYRCYFVTGSLLMLPMLGPIAKVKLAEMTDPKEIEKCRDILTEKAERILDDMEHWHLHTRNLIEKWQNA
ncbi:unnamed protein product [Caenorhabditis brenneri]